MAQSVYDLEFNGPFPDWWNVVDDFGADPTGVADSTGAFQAMFNRMSLGDGGMKSGKYAGYTGYVPSGTYNISNRLLLPDKSAGAVWGEGINIWGQDPATTILRWTHPNWNTSMLWSDGCHTAVIGRLTFDGAGVAWSGVRLERDPDIGLNNSYCRLQDCIFKDLNVGFEQTDQIPGVGTDSEFSILRCHFYRCSDYGVRVESAEAYNYWVRQGYFEDCRIGIANGPSGAFSAYDNVFVRSTEYDIYATAMRLCGIRRNKSFDSKRFLYVNCSNIVIEGNEVSNSTETDTVQLNNRFKVMLLNNRFKSAEEATTGPVINELIDTFNPSNPRIAPFAPLFAFFNQFTVDNAIHIEPQTPTSNDIFGNVVNPSLALAGPVVTPQPPQVIRPTFYLDAEDDPQGTIDAAAAHAEAHPGSEPVVYLPCYHSSIGAKGVIGKTLVFPANTKMSLQGGGMRTCFRWDPATRLTYLDPYVLFRGPSKVTVQNMTIGLGANVGHKAGLIAVFDGCDQVGSRALTDNCEGSYRFDGLSRLKADVCDHLVHASNPENLPFFVSAPHEAHADSRVLHEAGAGSDGEGREPMFGLQGGGKYYLREYWYETTNTDKLWAKLDGMGGSRGHFGVEASLIEQHTSSEGWKMKAIEATDWWGSILYLNDLIIGTTKLTGIGSRVDYESFGGGSPLRSDSAMPATMYRQDGIPYHIIDFWTMSLTMESFADNSGWGVFGSKPATWQEPLWNTANRVPTTWIDVLGNGVTDVRLHRVTGDVTFMADTYILRDDLALVETTDFMSGVLPSDATFARSSGAMVFNTATKLIYGPENLVPYSQAFTNPSWTAGSGGTGSNPVLTANDAIAPDGTLTATKAEFDSGAGTTSADWSLVTSGPISLFNPQIYSYSVWVKASPGVEIYVATPDYEHVFNNWSGEWMQFAIGGPTNNSAPPGTMAIGIRQTSLMNSTATVWIWGAQLERNPLARVYIPTTSTVEGGARFEHDAASGALLGVLNEAASSNGIDYSQYATGWTATNVSFNHGPPASPAASHSIIITADVGAGDHYGGSTATASGAGVTVGHSVFVRRGSTRYVVLLDDSDAVWHGATFDFDTGAWVGTGTNVTLLPPQECADGWWRIGWTATMTNNVGAVQIAPAPVGIGTVSDINYVAAGTEDVYLTGPQFEAADSTVSSFILTQGGLATRAAEVLQILRDNGTYDVEITRQDGVQTLVDQVVSAGTFTVPTSTSPVIKVVTTRK